MTSGSTSKPIDLQKIKKEKERNVETKRKMRGIKPNQRKLKGNNRVGKNLLKRELRKGKVEWERKVCLKLLMIL